MERSADQLVLIEDILPLNHVCILEFERILNFHKYTVLPQDFLEKFLALIWMRGQWTNIPDLETLSLLYCG